MGAVKPGARSLALRVRPPGTADPAGTLAGLSSARPGAAPSARTALETPPTTPSEPGREPDPPTTALLGIRETGARAARNTAARGGAEIASKLASLVLFGALARAVGASQLGVFVFAFSFVQIAIVPVDLGFDSFLTREVARDRDQIRDLFPAILATKVLIAVPVLLGAVLLVGAIRDDELARQTVLLLSLGLFLDSVTRTVTGVFVGLERGGMVAYSITSQRVSAALLGLAVLATGHGVTAVALTYTAGSALGLAVGLALLGRALGGLPLRGARPRLGLVRPSLPFALRDGAAVLLYKLDDVMLSLLATDAAVGRYGAAYRLLEATFFIVYSLQGGFAAMYVYLGTATTPTVGAAFGRSIKAALALLVPVGVTFLALAEPLARLVFGGALAGAAGPLRLLGPVAVTLAVFTLSATLVLSRSSPRPIVVAGVSMTAANLLLNLALIPLGRETGAAAAILVTSSVFTVAALRLAARVVGGLHWRTVLSGPLVAGAAMAVPAVALHARPALALAAAGAVYVVALVLIELRTSPGDVRFVRELLRRRVRVAG